MFVGGYRICETCSRRGSSGNSYLGLRLYPFGGAIGDVDLAGVVGAEFGGFLSVADEVESAWGGHRDHEHWDRRILVHWPGSAPNRRDPSQPAVSFST